MGPNGEKTVAAVLKIAQMGAKFFICNSAQLAETTNQKEHIKQQLINNFQKCIQK
jgi:hypothetical protein